MARLRIAWICYLLSVATIVCGVILAAHAFPEPFEWTRMVMSRLASRKYNPDGGMYFAGALGVSMGLLWPVSRMLGPLGGAFSGMARYSILAFRTGSIFGLLVAVERLMFFHFSDYVRQGHELIALVAFLGFYGGLLGLYVDDVRSGSGRVWSAALVLVPLVAVGFSELALYAGEWGIGWVNSDWRQADRPVWMRFALWQWMATWSLWLAVGILLARRTRRLRALQLGERTSDR